MRQSIAGIDLGTSSVKILQWFTDGEVRKAKEHYDGVGTGSWIKAICKALSQLDTSSVIAVGCSSQVGTYVVDGEHVISWNAPEGREELTKLKEEVDVDTFIREISMPHPEIQSYPMPRLLYIKKKYGTFKNICQPKDFLMEVLTGNRVTDPYSWRGLVNLETGLYSDWALSYVGAAKEQLPRICRPDVQAGVVRDGLKDWNLRAGTPVYIGCNDFFAGLLGMGLRKHVFDITGTSEHIGVITKQLIPDTSLVSGPYIKDFIHYGVTASSGVSMEFCLENFLAEVDIEESLEHNPPIFLPYLNGERAPIWNPEASGVFFGITGHCKKEHLAYAVMEGIVFGLYHIYKNLSAEKADSMIVTGGAAKNRTLNTLKAELFELPVETRRENDASALGAVMLSAVGHGMFENLEDAARVLCITETVTKPCGKYRERLLRRFELFKKLYPSLEPLFAEKRTISQEP